MSKGFGKGSSKKKKNVKQLYLDNQFAEGKKFYLAENYSKAELIFLNLKIRLNMFQKLIKHIYLIQQQHFQYLLVFLLIEEY